MTRQNRYGGRQSESLSCKDVLILWCNSVARSVGNACTQRGRIYVTPSTAVYPLELLVTLVNLDLSISDYFNNIKKLLLFFSTDHRNEVGASRHKESLCTTLGI